MCAALSAHIHTPGQEVDMLTWTSRAALEHIGQGGLGYSFDDFTSATPKPYTVAAKALFPAIWDLILFRQFVPFLVQLGPTWLRRWAVERFPSERLQKVVQIVDILDATSREVFESKKEALRIGDEAVKRQVGEGKDIMSVLRASNYLFFLESVSDNPIGVSQGECYSFSGGSPFRQ